MNTAAVAPTLSSLSPFVNEPFLDFGDASVKRAMEAALLQVSGDLGREYALVIGGKRIRTTEKIVSVNPCSPGRVVGVHQMAEAEHAGRRWRPR